MKIEEKKVKRNTFPRPHPLKGIFRLTVMKHQIINKIQSSAREKNVTSRIPNSQRTRNMKRRTRQYNTWTLQGRTREELSQTLSAFVCPILGGVPD